jgi:hypothetical protein
MALSADIARGITHKQDWGTYIDQETRLYQTKLAERAQEEQRAWKIGEMLTVPQGHGEYYSEQIKRKGNQVLEEVGQFMLQNKNWFRDPFKAAWMKGKESELKDNDWTRASIALRTNEAALQEWLSQPQNAELASHPHVKKMQEQLAMVYKTGDIEGITEKGRNFNFTPPPKVNMPAAIQELAKTLQRDGSKMILNGLGEEKFVSDQNFYDGGESIYNDLGSLGIAARAEWMTLQQEQPEIAQSYNNNPALYYASKLRVWAPDRERTFYDKTTMAYSGAGGTGIPGQEQILKPFKNTVSDQFLDKLERGMIKRDGSITVNNPDIANIFDEEVTSLDDAVIYDNFGNPLKLDIYESSNAIPTGELIYRPRGGDREKYIRYQQVQNRDGSTQKVKIKDEIDMKDIEMTYVMPMMYNQVNDLFKSSGHADPMKGPNWYNLLDWGDPNNFDNVNMDKKFKGVITPNYELTNSTGDVYYNVRFTKPLDPSRVQAYNAQFGKKPDVTGSVPQYSSGLSKSQEQEALEYMIYQKAMNGGE